jgi:hypothetical protein
LRDDIEKVMELDECNRFGLDRLFAHVGQCKSIVQRPTPATDRECTERAANLQHALAGTIDDAGYRPIQVTCMYAYPDRDGE